MVPFKILQGEENNLPSEINEGYVYFTTDKGNLYIDISNGERKQVNKGVTAVKVTWQKGVSITDFEYTETDDTVTLTKYTGSNPVVSLGEYIDVPNVTTYSNSGTTKKKIIIDGSTCFKGNTTITKVYFDENLQFVDNSMQNTFLNCTNLTTVPIIPNSVTNIGSTFFYCASLTTAPVIPDSVINMNTTFFGCTSLTTAPIIPNNVTQMYGTFQGCTNLTGTLEINANPTFYTDCFKNCSTNSGTNLKLTGSSTVLNILILTKSDNSNISIL